MKNISKIICILFISIASGQELLFTVKAHDAAITRIIFSPEGTHLATMEKDGPIKFWRISDGKLVSTLALGLTYKSVVELSPDGIHLATMEEDGPIKFWRISDGKLVSIVALGPEDNVLFFNFMNSEVIRIGTGSWKSYKIIRRTWKDDITYMENQKIIETFGGELQAIYEEDGKSIELLNLRDNSIANIILDHGTISRVAFVSEGKVLSVYDHEKKIYNLFKTGNGEYIATIGPFVKPFWINENEGSGADPIYNQIAIYGDNNKITLWRYSDGKKQLTFKGKYDGLLYLANLDSTTITGVYKDGTIRLWDISNGKLLNTRKSRNTFDMAMRVKKKGDLMALGYENGEIYLRQIGGEERDLTISTGHETGLWTIFPHRFISPDGQLLTSVDSAGIIKLWRTNDGTLLKTFDTSDSSLVVQEKEPEPAPPPPLNYFYVIFDLQDDVLRYSRHLKGGRDRSKSSWTWIDGKRVERLWFIEERKFLKDYISGEGKDIIEVAFDGENILFATGYTDGSIKLWLSPSVLKKMIMQADPDLLLPQDEFETNDEYAQRLERVKLMKKKLLKQYLAERKAKMVEAERLAAERVAERNRLLQIKIAESLAPMEFTPQDLGGYNAENNTFPFKISGKSYTVNVPRSEARDFKKEFSTVKVEGYKQLQRDLITYDYFNMVAIHPITGSRFPFGPTKDLAAAPVIASKKSVVPPDLSMRVAFVEPNGNGFLDAEEKGKVKVSISNSGKGSAMGVFVKLDAETSNQDISAGTSKIIGEVPAGQTKTAEFDINASKSVKRMENRFTVSATESYGFPPDPAQISFETFPFIPPKLELVDFGVSTPNEGNEIRPQTTTEVQARVQNRGQGPAEDVQFSINLPKGVYFTPDSRQDYFFSSLKPGEFKDLEFSFNTAKTVGKSIDVSIGFTEESTTGKFPLKLDVEKPQQTIQQLVVSGQEMGTMEFADVATVSVDIEKDIPTSGRKGEFDLAIVFGIESYKNVPGVSFAKRDAEWMKKYFENVLGIPKNRIYYRTDSDVGQAEFSKVFSEGGWLDKRLKEDKTNIFIYYAGHGAPDMTKNKAYLIPYDGDPNYASQTGYEMDALYEQLGNLGAASVTVFLDACFSGANRDNEMLLADARPVFMEVDESATRDVTVFSAAGGKEISSAWPEKKHGLFSYYLMKGMRGDADENGDKQITVGELGDYVKENVSDMAGMLDREQTPGLRTLDEGKVLISY